MSAAGESAPTIRRRWPLVLAFLLAAVLAAYYGLRRADLRAFVETRLSEAAGRPVRVGGLSLAIRPWTRIELTDVRLANLPGAPDPTMLRIGTLRAELDLRSLLQGPLRLRAVSVADATLRLERVGPTWNWVFRPGTGPEAPRDLRRIPSLRDLAIRNATILYRLPNGLTLRTALATATLAGDGDNRPMHLAASGAYIGIPLGLTATLGTLDAFRKLPVPFPAHLDLTAPDAALTFDGTLTDPLDLDGAAGRLTARATLGAALRFGGVQSPNDLPLALAGPFRRSGDHWRIESGNGQVGGNRFTARRLAFDEGAPHQPDAIAADLAFERLDLASLAPAGPANPQSAPDLPLAAEPNPDPRLDLTLAADDARYGDTHLNDLALRVERLPNRLALDRLRLGWLGARLDGTAAVDQTGQLGATLSASGADIGTVAHALGFGDLPLGGTAAATATLSARGATLTEAMRNPRLAAVASIGSGRIQSRVVELASTDLRLIWRRPTGDTPILCGLAVVTATGPAGAISPFRIATSKGTLAGRGTFDLKRRTLDLVFATERASTHFLALDIPIRVSGSFADPRIRPARLSAKGRAELARLLALPALPPVLLGAAKTNRCYR